MELRDRILAAAARVYAETGFRGATTRRIAAEAGVNEVTLFRHFGSKSSLISEAIGAERGALLLGSLPEEPADPSAELTAWAEAVLELLREKRALIRTCMGDFEEHPEMMPPCGSPTARAAEALCEYVERLRRAGLATGNADPRVAASMLMGALFADAMGRDIMTDLYRSAPDEAVAGYVRLFLRGIGVEVA
ncbi:MAG TPA: helix-turn-helix domain-containing protein [Gemmatimonadales bacterium]|jgi:AcrR family transcriptional regulator|nr:helix-turn-helix domain-containing protein [Gemmatimonadales bacterium]